MPILPGVHGSLTWWCRSPILLHPGLDWHTLWPSFTEVIRSLYSTWTSWLLHLSKSGKHVQQFYLLLTQTVSIPFLLTIAVANWQHLKPPNSCAPDSFPLWLWTLKMLPPFGSWKHFKCWALHLRSLPLNTIVPCHNEPIILALVLHPQVTYLGIIL